VVAQMAAAPRGVAFSSRVVAATLDGVAEDAVVDWHPVARNTESPSKPSEYLSIVFLYIIYFLSETNCKLCHESIIAVVGWACGVVYVV